MKKRTITTFFAVIMVVALFSPISQANYVPEENDVTVTDLGNGFTVEGKIILEKDISSLSLMSTKLATKKDVYKINGTEIATVSITASFGYDGSTSWVNRASVSKSVSSGWTYSDENITTSGGTATVTATLKKFPYNVNVYTYISCSADGDIS